MQESLPRGEAFYWFYVTLALPTIAATPLLTATTRAEYRVVQHLEARRISDDALADKREDGSPALGRRAQTFVGGPAKDLQGVSKGHRCSQEPSAVQLTRAGHEVGNGVGTCSKIYCRCCIEVPCHMLRFSSRPAFSAWRPGYRSDGNGNTQSPRERRQPLRPNDGCSTRPARARGRNDSLPLRRRRPGQLLGPVELVSIQSTRRLLKPLIPPAGLRKKRPNSIMPPRSSSTNASPPS